jgi:diadenosine tetraphosphatase ApaH/serine/threonine PP2A family protein phosphatase
MTSACWATRTIGEASSVTATNTDLVNPGSIGMPLDGDVRAAWATWNGDFTFRRTEYDVERAAAAYRALGGAFGEMAARRIERGSD